MSRTSGAALPVSILDLAPIVQGGTAAAALRNSLDLAQHAERWGYKRFWLAEHHNMAGIASAATAVVIAHVASGTTTIRVGAGGIMLPNHAPLVIAEQFGTLAALHPGRIDLGLGRAPGTDQRTMRALRQIARRAPRASRGTCSSCRLCWAIRIPIRLCVPSLGSAPTCRCGFSARASSGLSSPRCWACPTPSRRTSPQTRSCRRSRSTAREFQASAQLQSPYAMVAANVIAADDDAEARRLFTSQQQAFTNMVRDRRGQLQPPIDDMEAYWSPAEKAHVTRMLHRSFVGSADTVAAGLERFVEETSADELIVATAIHDHTARLRSYEILAATLQIEPDGARTTESPG